MITVSKTRNGKYVAKGTARITSDPSYKTVGQKETPLTSFFVNSDVIGQGAAKEYENYLIQCWDKLAAYGSNFEKNDIVCVEGECKRNEYQSKKTGKDEYMIDVHTIFPANIGEIVFQLQQVISLLGDNQGTNVEHANDPSMDGYEDLQIPDDLFEPDI